MDTAKMMIFATEVIGKRAIVVEPITRRAPGRIRFQGTTWPAKSLGKSFRVGDHVLIAALDNITMIVERRCKATSSMTSPSNGDR